MDDPDITMKEYIRIVEEKAHGHGNMYNWETATYGKIWYDEDVYDLRFVETKLPAIVFNETLTSDEVLSCEPTLTYAGINTAYPGVWIECIDFMYSFRRQNKRRTPNVVEPELRTIVEVEPMAENRTMKELSQAPTEGYGEAIIIPEINADHFEIKTNLLQLVQANPYHGFERENPHTHINNFKRITSSLKFRENASKTDDRIDKLADQISTLVDIFAKKVVTPAPVKAVEESCVTCGGPHSHYNCDATNSNQPSVCVAMGTYNQVAPQNCASNYMAPPGFAPVQNNSQNRFNQNQGQGNRFNRGNNFHGNQPFQVPNQGFQNQPFQVPNNPVQQGRSFLRSGCALIDVYREEITLWVNDEALTFNLIQTTRYSSTYDDLSVNQIDIIDVAREEYAQKILGFSKNSSGGNPTSTSEHILSDSSPSLTSFEGSDFILEEIEAYLKDESISLEIDHADCDPEGDICVDKLPVIVAKDLKVDEKEVLLKVLKSHKRAIAWKNTNIKGIDPRFCIHKILMEEDYKPTVQSQRRVNPKNHEVIKKEVIKLLDVGMIFLILTARGIVYTDHSDLKYLLSKQDAKPRLTWWVLLLQEFDIIIHDKKRTENLTADHLSRLENPHKDVFENKDINENFPLETLVMFKYGVTHRLATAYHPQTSGQVKVSNQGLKCILERTVRENRASWSEKLEDALWAFKTAYKTPIGCTPYKLVYGKSCHLPIELEHKAYWALRHVNFDLKTVGDHRKLQLNELNELRDQAYKNSLIYKDKTKKLHDPKIKNRIFNVGDRVLLFNSRLKIFSRKLKTRWLGPFTITKVFPYRTVELSQPDGPNFKVNGHPVKHYFGEDAPLLVVPDLQTFPIDK
nr:reverse transcriptase domain-containing protein [Tanacetum cinerariifolium]